jgi:cell division septation protein DedD
LASHSTDDGFHEIQLNGKQLVFLFMAATVVSVVIFLCGVLVGRGVRADNVDTVEAAALTAPATTELPPVASSQVATAQPEPPAEAPRPAVEDLSYFDRLGQPTPQAEELSARPAVAARSGSPPPSAPAREPVPASAAGTSSTPAPVAAAEPRPFAVQIAALNVRNEADAMAKRLSAKGYAAFVLSPADGTPTVYRVRIGPFKTRREADTVAARLQKEEQFKPWVTR